MFHGHSNHSRKLIELFDGEPPYTDCFENDIYGLVVDGIPPTPTKRGTPTRNFLFYLEQVLVKEPKDRPKAEKLLKASQVVLAAFSVPS